MIRTLVLMSVLFLGLTGCQDDNRKLADLQAEIAALKAQVGASQRDSSLANQVAMLRMQVAALGAPQVPHLTVASTGEDLGLWLGGDCVWSVEQQAETCFHEVVGPLDYISDDCTGTAYSYPGRSSFRQVGPQGTWLRIEGSAPEEIQARTRYSNGACAPSEGMVSATAYLDTGIPGRVYQPRQLAVMLR